MKMRLFSAAFLAAVAAAGVARADEHRFEPRREGRATIAVFGDWPYSRILLNSAKLLIDSINSDPDVSLVMHVGDIHSGSMPCTSADILPPIATSNPGWNQQVYAIFQKFRSPVVYTPGDNEWTDCHKSKEGAAGDPLKELASVRSLFFARPGWTLGLHEMPVHSQAKFFSPRYPSDAQYVENMIWMDAKTVFATVNMPGSNNDNLPWSSFENAVARQAEMADRTAADIRWLQAAFDLAAHEHAAAVVVALQADMWDPAQISNGEGLDRYTGFVRELATQSLRFRRPVLVINGDSHLYGSDRPLADPSSATGKIHNTPAVPNLTRITVQGSTNKPAEWLRLTIDPHTVGVFRWTNVVYCADPTASCP
jgi:hypothetical protein